MFQNLLYSMFIFRPCRDLEELPSFNMLYRITRLDLLKKAEGFKFNKPVIAITFAGTAKIRVGDLRLIPCKFHKKDAIQPVCHPAFGLAKPTLNGDTMEAFNKRNRRPNRTLRFARSVQGQSTRFWLGSSPVSVSFKGRTAVPPGRNCVIAQGAHLTGEE